MRDLESQLRAGLEAAVRFHRKGFDVPPVALTVAQARDAVELIDEHQAAIAALGQICDQLRRALGVPK